VACTIGLRLDGVPAMMSASLLGNVLPAMWSFMLAARARGLGTAWTTVHLMQEQAAADLLGIPFGEVQQVCLSPLAFTVGTDFKPAARPDPDSVIHWDRW
jgi:nitroreductase